MTLYEINNEFESLMALYDNGVEEVVDKETGEIRPIQEAIEDLNLNKEEKVSNTILYLKNLKLLESGIKDEIKKLKERLEKAEKKRSNLEQYVVLSMGENKKLETPQYTLTVRPSVETIAPTKKEDILKLPKCFRVCSYSWKADKTAIKKALEEGTEVYGCQLAYKKNLKY